MVLKEKIDTERLSGQYNNYVKDMIKFCIDRKRKVIALDREMHIEMEHELYDDGSDYNDIFGGNIIIEDGEIVDIEWEAHPNIERNRQLGIGAGRRLTNELIIDELGSILSEWIQMG